MFTQLGGMGGGASATDETSVVPVVPSATGKMPVVPVAAKMAAPHTGGTHADFMRTRGSASLPEGARRARSSDDSCHSVSQCPLTDHGKRKRAHSFPVSC
jgi:hypothetical protein